VNSRYNLENPECFDDLIMFPLREIEGTWEELIQNADEFSGKRFKLTLLENNESRELELCISRSQLHCKQRI
jgi:hypothetical protein